MRPLCNACNSRPKAVNYVKGNRTYYRSTCEACMKYGKNYGIPRWKQAGYKKKKTCDKCGFKSNHSEIFKVFHVDANLNNCRPSNLKTVCANCATVISKDGISWKQGDLVADF